MREFYNTAAQKVITRRYFTLVPNPAHITNEIEKQANNDNMVVGITFKSINFNDNLWLAEVETDEDHIYKK